MVDENKSSKGRFKRFLAGIGIIGGALFASSGAQALEKTQIDSNNQTSNITTPADQSAKEFTDYIFTDKTSEIQSLVSAIMSKGYQIKVSNAGKAGRVESLVLFKNNQRVLDMTSVTIKFGEKIALVNLLEQINTLEKENSDIAKIKEILTRQGYSVVEEEENSRYLKIKLFKGNVLVHESNPRKEKKQNSYEYFLELISDKNNS